MLGKVKVTPVSLHQTHHSRHYSKLIHKIMYYRKCLANCTWCIFMFALLCLPSRERNKQTKNSRKTMRSKKSAQFQQISSFEQFFFILFPHILIQIVPFFFFWLAKKKFSLGQKVVVSRWGSLILWREGIKCNDGNVQTHQSHFSRPLVANQLLLIW